MINMKQIGIHAREAAKILSNQSTQVKNEALLNIANAIDKNREVILRSNTIDIKNAIKTNYKSAFIERLTLNDKRLDDIIKAIKYLIELDDPCGKIISGSTRPNGLKIKKISVPLGVIGMIYESRPNVTVDAATLCLKSGNACILRGGKETINTNKTLADIMRSAICQAGLSSDCIILLESTDRIYAEEMMKLNDYIDVLIPRGSGRLIHTVIENSTVPVIATGLGNCHTYIDYNADLEMAVSIADNAKNSRPSVCNAMETLLLHKDIANKALPKIKKTMDEYDTQLRCCPISLEILKGQKNVTAATEEDYATEYEDYILAVKVVSDVDEAIEHINKYATAHSEAIVTNDYENSRKFTEKIDSSTVYVNASTRFTDGGEFGLGAEIGISTQKLHARGPMGLDALTTVKFIVEGCGQIR
jgi:glutamate-5-semialdehyde dehydrogenase